jgi:DNA polymerase-1
VEAEPMRIFLFDTMSFVYRAYHAAAHQKNVVMATKAGFPTGATYIFARMLKKLIEDHKPEYFIACMEGGPGNPTFREKLYPQYKANRKGETPFDLKRQFPFIERIIDAYRFQRISIPGYEADDVIGTLAKKFYDADEHAQIFIVTGDKDMFQLVNDRTFVVNPMKELVADIDKVKEIVGVHPMMVADVMALRGDTVDNVPGAPGIGKKGSVDIILQYGSLEQALNNPEHIKRKVYRESLQDNRAQIELSKTLVTIDCNIVLPEAVSLELDEMKIKTANEDALNAVYRELEFASLLKKEELDTVEGFVEPAPPAQTSTATTMTDEQAQLALDSIL